MDWGPLKSAEKPRARSHGFSGRRGAWGVGVGVGSVGGGGGWGLGVAGCVRYGGGGWGLGWSRGHNRTSVGSHAGRKMKNVTNTNGARSHGSSGGAGCVGGGGGGWKCGKGGVLGVGVGGGGGAMTPGARGP